MHAYMYGSLFRANYVQCSLSKNIRPVISTSVLIIFLEKDKHLHCFKKSDVFSG